MTAYNFKAYTWNTLMGAGAFTSLVMSAAPSFAQTQNNAVQNDVAQNGTTQNGTAPNTRTQSNEALSATARDEILNDSRTTPSADAATTARTRGIPAPTLDIDSPNIDKMVERAAAAASCSLAELEFTVGSAELSQQDRQALLPVAQCLKNQRSAVMWLIGAADNQGADAANWVLAMNRAVAAKDALRAMGVEERQLIAVSAGPTGERAVRFALSETQRGDTTTR